MAQERWVQDPDAYLDYKWDYAGKTNETPGATSDWLNTGETITTATVVVDTGLTASAPAITDTDTSVTVWLSGGVAGTNFDVTMRI